jgi:hypothetical protein
MTNVYRLMPPPDEVSKEWRTPVKDLLPVRWLYFSTLLGQWRACHSHFEAAWRFARGDKIKLIDEQPNNVNGLWTGILKWL